MTEAGQHNGHPLIVEKWDLRILSDASKLGWGASCNGKSEWHINYLKLQAAFFALQSYTSQMENVSIFLRLDNTTAIAFINKMGGTHSHSLLEVVHRP